MRRTLIGVLIVAMLFPLGITTALAQDASPGASSMAGECLAPEIPPGTPTPMDDMEMAPPAASPEADVATPEDEMAIPPLSEPLTGGEPADDATAAEVEAAVRNLESCIASGMFVEASFLYTANGLMDVCGTANPYDGESCWSGLEITVQSVEDVQTYQDGSLSANVTYQFFSALQAEQFVFVPEGDFLLIDAMNTLDVEIPEGATVITGELVDYEFVLDATTAPAGDIAFDVTNTGEYPHELLVIALPEGVSIDALMGDESFFEQIQIFGATFAEPGQDAAPVVMIDVEPGTYTIVCFIDVPEGVPHVMRGMVLEFEVTAP